MGSNIFNHCMKNGEFALFINYMLSTKKVNYFDNKIFDKMKSIKLKDDFTLYDYFEAGHNEGQCGLSCMLLSLLYDDFCIVSGKNEYLKGTISSPNGEHTWLEVGGKKYDTSLELIYERGEGIGYEETSRLTKEELLECNQYRELYKMRLHGLPLLKDESIAKEIMNFILKRNIEKRDFKMK